MKYRLNKLAQYLRGWMGYFGISEDQTPGTIVLLETVALVPH